MKKSALLLSLLVGVLQTIHADPELKGSPPELAQFLNGVPKSASITGYAELKSPADRAIVTLKVTTESRMLQNALRLNQELRGKVLARLKDEGLPAERIQTSRFSSTPKYGWLSDKAKSYKVENFVKVTVEDEKEFQSVSGAVDAWPELQFMGIEFEQADKENLKAKVLGMACDKALQHKKVYEEKFGVRLVAKRFSEGPFLERNTQPPLGLNAMVATTAGRSLSEAASAAPMEDMSAPFGELTYSAEVIVEFSVEPK